MVVRRVDTSFVNHILDPRVSGQPDGFRHSKGVILDHLANIPGADIAVDVGGVVRFGTVQIVALPRDGPVRGVANRVGGVHLDE
jgi:hypothetical protein